MSVNLEADIEVGGLHSLCHCPERYYGLLTVPSAIKKIYASADSADLDGPTLCHGGTGMGSNSFIGEDQLGPAP